MKEDFKKSKRIYQTVNSGKHPINNSIVDLKELFFLAGLEKPLPELKRVLKPIQSALENKFQCHLCNCWIKKEKLNIHYQKKHNINRFKTPNKFYTIDFIKK